MSRPTSSALAAALSLALVLVVCLAILIFVSEEPKEGIYFFFAGPFLNRYQLGNMLDSTSLLILTGLGAAIVFKAGVFNLGGEGQAYLGALVASQIALRLSNFPPVLGLPVIFLGSALVAGLIGLLAGLLRWLWNIDELITSFLASGSLLPIIDYLVAGPLRDQTSYLLATPQIPSAFHLPSLLSPSNLNAGILIALVLSLLIYFFLYFTVGGYELRISGRNRRFATYGGIKTGLYIVGPMTAGAAMHGAAGAFTVTGSQYMCVQGGTAGIGWNGIAVALIAENHPLLVVPAALVFSYLKSAANAAMLNTDFSLELGSIIQGLVLLFITIKILGLRKKR